MVEVRQRCWIYNGTGSPVFIRVDALRVFKKSKTYTNLDGRIARPQSHCGEDLMALFADSNQSLKSAAPASGIRRILRRKLLVLIAAAGAIGAVVGCNSSNTQSTALISFVVTSPSNSPASTLPGRMPASDSSATPMVLFKGKATTWIKVAQTDPLPLEVDTSSTTTDILVGVMGLNGYYDFPVTPGSTKNNITLNISSGVVGGPYTLQFESVNFTGISQIAPVTLNVVVQSGADTSAPPSDTGSSGSSR